MRKKIKGKITFSVAVEVKSESSTNLSLYDYANEIKSYQLPETKNFHNIESNFHTVKQDDGK